MSNLVIYLNQALLFKWYAIRCDSKNIQEKDICLKGIGLHAQNTVTILDSMINIIRGGGLV